MAYEIKVVLIISAIIMFFIVTHFITSAKRTRELKKNIARKWGKQPERKYSGNLISSVSGFFINKSEENPNGFVIDDITWNDLDMDKVYMEINNTLSTAGEEYLYALMRQPVFDNDTLAKRNAVIDYLKENDALRSMLQLHLALLGKQEDLNVTDYLYGKQKKSSSFNIYLYRLLSCVAIISPILALLKPNVGVPIAAVSFFINMTVYYKAKNEANSQLEALNYIVRMVNCAKKISTLESEELSEYTESLKESYKKVKAVNKRAFTLFYQSGDVLVEYGKIALLKELIDYEVVFSFISNHRDDLLKIYETIGLLDSLTAIASYRVYVDDYCVPDLKPANGKLPLYLNFTDIRHPLIKKPVPNSLTTQKSVLITGSNASGKSTFLKATAINAIFAQTICTCLAKSYESAFFKVYSSMALKDSIVNNESYYIAEIKSLKRIIDATDSSIPCLCFIDEVLRGTNTIERIAASSEVLYYLSGRNCLCVAATHDIELTKILEAHFDNYHFQETFTDDEIKFDYKLYNGRSTSRNAIKLLKFMGYNEAIVEKAEKRAEGFMKDGLWSNIPPL